MYEEMNLTADSAQYSNQFPNPPLSDDARVQEALRALKERAANPPSEAKKDPPMPDVMKEAVCNVADVFHQAPRSISQIAVSAHDATLSVETVPYLSGSPICNRLGDITVGGPGVGKTPIVKALAQMLLDHQEEEMKKVGERRKKRARDATDEEKEIRLYHKYLIKFSTDGGVMKDLSKNAKTAEYLGIPKRGALVYSHDATRFLSCTLGKNFTLDMHTGMNGILDGSLNDGTTKTGKSAEDESGLRKIGATAVFEIQPDTFEAKDWRLIAGFGSLERFCWSYLPYPHKATNRRVNLTEKLSPWYEACSRPFPSGMIKFSEAASKAIFEWIEGPKNELYEEAIKRGDSQKAAFLSKLDNGVVYIAKNFHAMFIRTGADGDPFVVDVKTAKIAIGYTEAMIEERDWTIEQLTKEKAETGNDSFKLSPNARALWSNWMGKGWVKIQEINASSTPRAYRNLEIRKSIEDELIKANLLVVGEREHRGERYFIDPDGETIARVNVKPERTPEWKKSYDSVVSQIGDESLDKEVAERITDALINGTLPEGEFKGWVRDAKNNVEMYKEGDTKNGKPRTRDTITIELWKFYQRNGLKWTTANGGPVGKIKAPPKKKLYGINAFGERVEIDD